MKYFDADKKEIFQRAKAVVVCANGAETPRLLLNSKSNLFPNGLANSSGIVGKHLMFNGAGISLGVFEHEVNGYKGIVATRVVWDLYELDKKLGLVGGGGFDYRFDTTPINFSGGFLPPNAPQWGKEFKKLMAHNYNRTVSCFGHTSSLPVPTNSISLDPDGQGCVGHSGDSDDVSRIIRRISSSTSTSPTAVRRLLKASGATQTWQQPVESTEFSVHLLGTCRMGNDPEVVGRRQVQPIARREEPVHRRRIEPRDAAGAVSRR